MTESPFSHVEDIKPATTPDNASVAVADMFSASTVETPEVVDPIVNDSPNFEQPVEEVKVEEAVVEETVAEVVETPGVGSLRSFSGRVIWVVILVKKIKWGDGLRLCYSKF